MTKGLKLDPVIELDGVEYVRKDVADKMLNSLKMSLIEYCEYLNQCEPSPEWYKMSLKFVNTFDVGKL